VELETIIDGCKGGKMRIKFFFEGGKTFFSTLKVKHYSTSGYE